ncbi:AraC family transcriptional regulator [Paenibacillus sp. PK3_47]|uniref:helix-turn-helix transcriptional regulator n=1 Tax=Paenibacillus sp. PK3_47 TaxID=2072642 RepID=UPI00201D71A1|nr:AraC family transcriptional regulator [Paenibacillus sp. PK3_47]
MIRIMNITDAERAEMEKSGQLRMLRESFLLQLVSEAWCSQEAVKDRLCQLKLTPLAKEGVKLRYAAVQLELPGDCNGLRSGMQVRLQTEFQNLCRESADSHKHVYPFCDAVSPRLMHFLILSKEGMDKPDRWITELQHHIENVLKLRSTAAEGVEVKGLKRMKRAFACCMLSLYRNAVPIRGGMAENGASLKLSGIPAELERSLVRSLEAPDPSVFRRKLDELMALSEKEAGPLDAALYHAMQLLLNFTAISAKYEYGGSALSKYLWNSRTSLAACTSRTELTSQLLKLGELVMEEAEQARHSGGRHFAEAVRKYIDRNYGCELSLSSVAAVYGVDEAGLSRQFKQHVGVSPGDYITRIRMAKAEQLLQECALKLHSLSALVGCSSISHFVSSFKKYSGKSPKAYRQQVLKNR